ncbi:STAS domain-containing protein [Algoriphagus sp. AK58]|uniref:STAS domain-containing protein n=1 Tax=Algoriphagus sp. AK58 TaxID=1406877 RepID=UPI00164F7237|nr:STAS domain-containing protein [Algoriphagus sp. AK58]MBC6366332.1 anti-sigma F factor antagonist [Algoriphagus sp. AK58]
MLRLEKSKETQFDILTLLGEVDASNSVILDKAIQELVESGAKHILVDGQGLEYISSAGLGVFMSYLEDFNDQGIWMGIFGLPPRVYEVFKILGLDQLIPIFEDKSAAIGSLNEA